MNIISLCVKLINIRLTGTGLTTICVILFLIFKTKITMGILKESPETNTNIINNTLI